MSNEWVSVNINAETLDRADHFLKAFGNAAVPGTQRAMNRSIVGVRTDAVKATREVYNVKAGDVRGSFTIYRAKGGSAHGGMHGGRLQASAVSRGRRIPMAAFSPIPRTASRKRMPPVGASAMVRKGVRKTIPGAFIGTSGSGQRRMYIRAGGKYKKGGKLHDRLRVVSGPSVPSMIFSMNNPKIYEEIHRNARRRYEVNFEHEMDRLLKQLGVR